ncbi:MAG: outer membrane protein transport protein [Myxococcota bacterium]
MNATKKLSLFLLASTVLPDLAWAGGYVLPVHGVRALGMGGASVAGVSGADSFWTNPANLDESEISVEAAMLNLSSTFTPAGEGTKTVSSNGKMLPNPTLGFVLRVNDHFSFGVGAYSPWSAPVKYSEDGPQRYQMIANDQSIALFVHLAAAFRFGHFRFGGGIQNVMANIKQEVAVSAYTGLFGYAQDPTLDVVTQLDLNDPFTLTGNFGAAYDAGPFTFGAAVQLPFTIEGDAKVAQRLPSNVFFDNVTLVGDKAHLAIPFPTDVRAGVAFHATNWLTIEGAFGFEDWSVQQRLQITPVGQVLNGVPAIGTYRLGQLTLEKRMKDTYSVHLGADAEVTSGLHVRTGGFWESSAFNDTTYSAALPDDNKFGLGLGVSWRVGMFRLDASVARVFQGTRVVSTSELRQVNPTNPTQADVIGNGTYESGYWMGGLSVAFLPGWGASTAKLGKPEATLDTSIEEGY